MFDDYDYCDPYESMPFGDAEAFEVRQLDEDRACGEFDYDEDYDPDEEYRQPDEWDVFDDFESEFGEF